MLAYNILVRRAINHKDTVIMSPCIAMLIKYCVYKQAQLNHIMAYHTINNIFKTIQQI